MNGTATPEIAVVVTTRDREERLAALLEALAMQTIEPDRFEVIIVRLRDAPATALIPGSLNVTELRADQPTGPAAKRNIGWRASPAPLIAFSDDDCRPQPDWLEQMLAAHRQRDAATADLIVQGMTIPDPDERDQLGPFSQTRAVYGPALLYETCNISYPRVLLERVNGFDESFLGACGEDVDLGWRARAAGAGLVFCPEAINRHAVVAVDTITSIRSTSKWIDNVRVIRDYPELRSLLIARIFWRRSHPWLIFALVALSLALALHSPLIALAGVAPWAIHHLRRDDTPDSRGVPATGLPRQAAIDLAELLTMIRGSVRYRSLVL